MDSLEFSPIDEIVAAVPCDLVSRERKGRNASVRKSLFNLFVWQDIQARQVRSPACMLDPGFPRHKFGNVTEIMTRETNLDNSAFPGIGFDHIGLVGGGEFAEDGLAFRREVDVASRIGESMSDICLLP